MDTFVRGDRITPWGVGRMRPFPATAVLPAASMVLNAETQTADWSAPDDVPVLAMDRHRRSETSKETSTQTSLDGTPDQGSDQAGDSD
ncbi:putative ATP-grasp-modified RiPP [Streptomyces misionensis]|uniref:Putative ATP-grasp-modified RiPP n=1 Tax=Streptomyces misionensis TaxID=67331 RepID=A0A5C6JMD4_9ACTN|nr:putative ATP-grasp-modified RiPP [Streptomyces misionensis]TWV42676.1 putative ATP-grasp-modified RiPP [Streptomyces misionensis]